MRANKKNCERNEVRDEVKDITSTPLSDVCKDVELEPSPLERNKRRVKQPRKMRRCNLIFVKGVSE